MSFISELEENEELVEFEETWTELVKIEAMGGDAVKEAAMSDMSGPGQKTPRIYTVPMSMLELA